MKLSKLLPREPIFSVLVLSLFGLAACSGDESEADPALTVQTGDTSSISVPGFSTPESVVHDTRADIVSNINGGPVAKDNNGFLSQVAPDGRVTALNWVAGGVGGVVLHAPKGMTIRGDSLFVADVDTVRIFHRETGAPLGGWAVQGASLLNDLSVGADGTIYVTDTGLRAWASGALAPSGTDAVYRFNPTGTAVQIARSTDLANPNGVLAVDGGILIASGSAGVYKLDAVGTRTEIATPPAGQLDGIVRMPDGSLLVSSWGGQAVYRINAAGLVQVAVDGVQAPADIEYDVMRNRVLIPMFMGNTLEMRPVR
jgi:hypothetical protein